MTTRNTAQVSGLKLQPVDCDNVDQVVEAAHDGFRRRPVMARKPDGTLVVCCSRTAKKHGWTLEGRLFDRNPNRKTATEQPKKVTKRAKVNLAREMNLTDLLGG